jgi:hypothetical protein
MTGSIYQTPKGGVEGVLVESPDATLGLRTVAVGPRAGGEPNRITRNKTRDKVGFSLSLVGTKGSKSGRL